MTRAAALGLGSLCVVGVTLLAAQKPSERPRSELVEIDATVDDDAGRPVTGVQQKEFRIKEDGRAVTLSSFAEVSAAGISGEADSRSVVLLLDDTSMSPTLTQRVQNIARLFVNGARPADHLSVLRLRHREDETVDGRDEALSRINAYRSGSYPLLDDTTETWLKRLTTLARGQRKLNAPRTILVCIGTPALFDVYLAIPGESERWPYSYWVDAVSAAADANLSVYVVDPRGVTGRFDLGDGLVSQTGGDVFTTSNDFGRVVDLIWRDAGHYYRLGYAPTGRARELHSIDVSVTRSGVRVRAPRSRGN